MDAKLRDQLAAHLELYARQRADKGMPVGGDINLKTNPVQYGTAGFRGDAAAIEHIFFNVGLIAALRSLQRDSNVGIMITASHNPVQDNGIKLIECNGDMLSPEFEPIVERFCNIHDKSLILEDLDSIIESYKIEFRKANQNARIFIGMDTRPSSEALASLVKQGLEAWSPLVNYIEYGHITTPALHYLVAESTKRQIREISIESYYRQLISGLVNTFNFEEPVKSDPSESYSSDDLVIDCANGIGFETMQNLCKNEQFSRCLNIDLINIGDGILNKLCGADYVKTMHLPPSGADNINKRYASLDGDADRVVYFFLDKDKDLRLNLLDGDKIMALYAFYLKDILRASELDKQLSLGVVQTAYANGSSTDYITKELGIAVDCVDTGVKNLHKKALDYDFGIYFEANGHGTICVSDRARKLIDGSCDQKVLELKKLIAIIINYTGDAISDILVVETILRKFNWHIRRWFELYRDRPSSLIKIHVKDRSKIETANAARTCIQPEGLQSFIDSTVTDFGEGARCFVRASGTEDIVRVYAEARDSLSAAKLAETVGHKVKQLC